MSTAVEQAPDIATEMFLSPYFGVKEAHLVEWGSGCCSARVFCPITFHPGIVGSNPDRVGGFSYYLDFPLPRRVSYGWKEVPSAKTPPAERPCAKKNFVNWESHGSKHVTASLLFNLLIIQNHEIALGLLIPTPMSNFQL